MGDRKGRALRRTVFNPGSMHHSCRAGCHDARTAGNAGYGDELITRLAHRLKRRFGKGFSPPNLRNMRQFFLTFREGSAVPMELGGPTNRLAPPSVSAASIPLERVHPMHHELREVVGEAQFVGVVFREPLRGLVEAERRRERAEIADLEDEVERLRRLALPPPKQSVSEREVPVQVAKHGDVQPRVHDPA